MTTTEALPKIFVFLNSITDWGYNAVAVSEDGHAIAGHCSSSLGFARRDMGLTPHCDWQHDKYYAHYPQGYQVVDLIDESPTVVTGDAECMAAIAILNARGPAVPDRRGAA